ncbi:MAG: MFS transporter [Xanthobacteraceae bacterium]
MPAGIAANSVGVNISRALGPALGGMAISGLGIVAPFWINTVSNLGIVGALGVVAGSKEARHAAAGGAFRPGDVGRPSLRQT